MRMRIPAAVAAALATALIDAPAAGAQQWWQLCTGGGPTSCAALHVSTTALGGGGTQIAVRAQNLQGTLGTTGPSLLEQIFVHFDGSPFGGASGLTQQPTAGPGVTTYAGSGDLAGASVGPWSWASNGATIALNADNPDLGWFTDIRGCDGPSPLEDPGFRTCGSRGTRWVELLFDVDATVDASSIQSVGFGTAYGDFGLERHVCNDTPNSNVACRVERFDPSQQVVPEPATVTLLGGGLAALAGIVVRRRTRTA